MLPRNSSSSERYLQGCGSCPLVLAGGTGGLAVSQGGVFNPFLTEGASLLPLPQAFPDYKLQDVSSPILLSFTSGKLQGSLWRMEEPGGYETKEAVLRCSVPLLSSWGTEPLATLRRHVFLNLFSPCKCSSLPIKQRNIAGEMSVVPTARIMC